MNHPQMFVAGITLAFFLVPELLVVAKNQGAFGVQYLGGICSIPDFL